VNSNAPALAPWASHPAASRGRRVAEPPSPPRNEHQRDRDRIVHSNAFRRLVYKTQVFINHEGDLFRTRLTHSLEVAQLGRSVARALALNEDLVEAIALAHDLGHTPFGHAGQDALADCMAGHGGFEHNLQSLRVVDRLEARYARFDGLNLTLETREGILKRCSRRHAERLLADEPTGPAWRFVHGGSPSLEAQLVNLADELAYCAHDVDDGVRSGLLPAAALHEVPVFARHAAAVRAAHPALDERRSLFESLRRLLSTLIGGVVEHTAQALAAAQAAESEPLDAAAVRALPPLVALPAALRDEMLGLKRFLFAALYRHPQVVARTGLAREVVAELFAAYRSAPLEMGPDHARPSSDPARTVADYIAGMTDRFALREHQRLTGRRLFDV
jgi:dGTPase